MFQFSKVLVFKTQNHHVLSIYLLSTGVLVPSETGWVGVQIKPTKSTSTDPPDGGDEVVRVDILEHIHPVVETRPLKDLMSRRVRLVLITG
jgi:hypothetical protein